MAAAAGIEGLMFQSDLAGSNTVKIQSGEAIAQQRKMKQIAAEPGNEWQKAVNGALSMANSLVAGEVKKEAAKSTMEANNARARYVRFINSEKFLSSQPDEQANLFEQEFNDIAGESEAYTTAYLGYASGKYGSAFAHRQKKVEDETLSSSGAAFENWQNEENYTDDAGNVVTNKEAYGKETYSNFVNYFANTHNLTHRKSDIGMALAADQMSIATANLTSATSRQELMEIDLDNQKMLSGIMEHPMFGANKSAEGKQFYGQLKAQYSAQKALIDKQLKNNARIKIAEGTKSYESDTRYGVNPLALGTALDDAYDDPIAKQNATDKLMEAAKEQSIRIEFNTNNNTLDRTENVPDVYKKQWDKKVTEDALHYFDRENYDLTAQVITNNPGFTKKFGDTLYQRFNQAKTVEEAEAVSNKILMLNSAVKGGTAIRQAVGKDNYTEIIGTIRLAKFAYGGDVVKAKASYNESKNNFVPFNKDMKQTLDKHTHKLGRHAAAYRETLQTLYNVNPAIAIQSEPDIREFYLSQTEEAKKDILDGRTSIKFDTSMAPNLFTSDLVPADKQELYQLKFLDLANERLGDGDKEFISLPNGDAQIIDKYGFGSTVKLNVRKYIQEQEKDSLLKRKETPSEEPVVDEAVSELALMAHNVKYRMERDVENISKFFSNLFTTSNYKEAKQKLNELHALHSTTPAKDIEIAEETRDDSLLASDEYAQSYNEQIKKQLEVYSLVIALSEREGSYDRTKSLHKPSTGSGWTLGPGLDFSQQSRETLKELGVPKRYLDAADRVGAWKSTTTGLPSGIKPLTKKEYQTISLNVAKKNLPVIDGILKRNPDLNISEATELVGLLHWAGRWNNPNKMRASDGSFPIKDIVEKGGGNKDTLINGLTKLQKRFSNDTKTCGSKSSHSCRYTTITNTINRLKGAS